MQHLPDCHRSRLAIIAVASAAFLSACGGGGSVEIGVGGGGNVPVISIGLTAAQIAPRTVQVNWQDDPAAAFFRVRGEGTPLADVNATVYIDRSVFAGFEYCYDVAGYDAGGRLTAVSNVVCLTVI